MVNTLRRSKACGNCRKRRVKCDLKKPGCSQCQRQRRPCPGYAEQCIFVQQSLGEQRGSSCGSELKIQSHSGAFNGSHNDLQEEQMALMASQKMPLGPLYRQQLLQYFISSYVPKSPVAFAGQTHWPMLVAEMSEPTTALELSFVAVATSALGRANGDISLIGHGLRYHGRGLRELQVALNSPAMQLREETLAACVILLIHEAIECPAHDRSGFLSHQRGALQLIKMRGPRALSSPLMRRVFSTVRLLQASSAFENNETSFLSEPDWTTIPWAGERKPIFEQVVDLLLVIPAKQKEAQLLLAVPRQYHAETVHEQILFYAWIDKKLSALQKEQEESGSGASYWPVLSKMKNTADDHVHGKVFPVTFQFQTLGAAMTMIILWTTKAIVWTAIEGLRSYLGQLAQDEGLPGAASYYSRLPSLGHEKGHWISIARDACQCVEYCLQEPVSNFAQLTVAIPLQLLTGFFSEYPECWREFEWAKSVLSSFGGSGLRLLQYELRRLEERGG